MQLVPDGGPRDDPAVRVLYAEGSETGTTPFERALAAVDDRIAVVSAVEQGAVEETLRTERVDAVVCEHAPPALDALAVLATVRERDAELPVIVYAPEADVAADAFRAKATDFIPTAGDTDHDLLAERVVDAIRDRKSLDRYRQIFHQSSEGIVVLDPSTGDILETNDRFSEMLDYSTERDLTVGDIADSGGEFTAAEARRRVRRTTEAGRQTFEWRNVTADGDELWVEVTLEPATLGGDERVLAFVRDTTERHEFERRAAQARERMERVVERIDDAFFAVDDDWRFTYVNDEAARLLDHSAEALLGENVWEAFPAARDTAFQAEYERAMATQSAVSLEEYFDPLDLWVEVDAYPSSDGLSVFFRDISDRKRREQTLSDLLDVTRDLMRADTEADIADLITDAAAEVLGHEYTAVRYHDPETDGLPAASRNMPADVDFTLPSAVDGGTFLRDIFASGEPRILDDLEAVTDHDYAAVESSMVLPLGEHGLLTIGADETAAFDDVDLSVARLLAANATAAIERVHRRQDLERYEAVLRSVEGMVCAIDADGDFSVVTEPLADFLGVDRADLLGAPAAQYVEDGDREDWAAYVQAVTAGERDGDPFETAVVDAAGERHPVEIEASALRGSEVAGVAVVVRDIGELVATRRRVTAQRQRFAHLFRTLPDPVVEVALDDHTVESVNDAFVDVFGPDRESVVGRPLERVVRPPDGARAADAGGGSSDVDEEATDERFPDPDGDPRTYEVERATVEGARDFLFRAIPHERDGRAYAFCVYTDITEQKERERYLGVLNRLVRHNLRNSLTVITGHANELREALADPDSPAPDLLDHVDVIRDQTEELYALSEDARDVEAVFDDRDADRTALDVAAVLAAVADRHRRADPPVDLSVRVPDALPVVATAHLERALDELVENAIRHGPVHPTVEIEAGPAERDGWVAVRIRDDGPGIPDEEWQTVVGDEEITQLSHSTGLGLWLVRWIVDSSGGELRRVEREDGTEIVLSLQRPPADAGAGSASATTD